MPTYNIYASNYETQKIVGIEIEAKNPEKALMKYFENNNIDKTVEKGASRYGGNYIVIPKTHIHVFRQK